jgi:hypothetical protein
MVGETTWRKMDSEPYLGETAPSLRGDEFREYTLCHITTRLSQAPQPTDLRSRPQNGKSQFHLAQLPPGFLLPYLSYGSNNGVL